MDSPGDDAGLGLERYRSDLLLLARLRLGPSVPAQVGASDVVRQTLRAARRDFAPFRHRAVAG
jgi:hypothetical protein